MSRRHESFALLCAPNIHFHKNLKTSALPVKTLRSRSYLNTCAALEGTSFSSLTAVTHRLHTQSASSKNVHPLHKSPSLLHVRLEKPKPQNKTKTLRKRSIVSGCPLNRANIVVPWRLLVVCIASDTPYSTHTHPQVAAISQKFLPQRTGTAQW